jgi:hypothetical protein
VNAESVSFDDSLHAGAEQVILLLQRTLSATGTYQTSVIVRSMSAIAALTDPARTRLHFAE